MHSWVTMTTKPESNEPKLFPEQENPPRPTYEANLRGVTVCGWLYYAPTNGNPDNGQINIIITVSGNRVMADEFIFTTAEERSRSRRKAKNVWRSAVLAVLSGV